MIASPGPAFPRIVLPTHIAAINGIYRNEAFHGLGNRHWRRGGPGHCHARRHPGADLCSARPASEHLQRIPIDRSRRTHLSHPENQRPAGPDHRRQARPADHPEPGHDGPPPEADGQRLGGPVQRRQDPARRGRRRRAAVPVLGQGAGAEGQGRSGAEHDRAGGRAEADRHRLRHPRRHPDPAVPAQGPGRRRRERRRRARRLRLRRGALPAVRLHPARDSHDRSRSSTATRRWPWAAPRPGCASTAPTR